MKKKRLFRLFTLIGSSFLLTACRSRYEQPAKGSIAYGLDPSALGICLGVEIIMVIWTVYNLRKAYEIYQLKKQCTVKVSAEVTRLREAPVHVFGNPATNRRTSYNAAYRYQYGEDVCNLYDGSNIYYGHQHGKPFKVGDTVTIRINPDFPRDVYDTFADSALHQYAEYGIVTAIFDLWIFFYYIIRILIWMLF